MRTEMKTIKIPKIYLTVIVSYLMKLRFIIGAEEELDDGENDEELNQSTNSI